MPGSELEPWWLAIAGGIASTLLGAIGKIWSENGKLRRELAEANAQIVSAQIDAADRSDDAQRRHRRDLQSLIGLPTSLAPQQQPMSAIELPVIRAAKPIRRARKSSV